MRAIPRPAETAALIALWTWSAYAYGQRAGFGTELFRIDGLVWLAVIGLAAVGGLASLLPKLHDPDHPVRSVPLAVASHLAGSIVAGLLTFFKAVDADFSDMEVAASITIAGFVGTWLLEKARVKFFGLDAAQSQPERRSGIDRRDGGV